VGDTGNVPEPAARWPGSLRAGVQGRGPRNKHQGGHQEAGPALPVGCPRQEDVSGAATAEAHGPRERHRSAGRLSSRTARRFAGTISAGLHGDPLDGRRSEQHYTHPEAVRRPRPVSDLPDPARSEVHPQRRGHPSRPEALEHRGERGLRAAHPGLWLGASVFSGFPNAE